MKQVQKYYGQSYSVRGIEPGDKVPMGDDRMVSDDLNQFIEADFEALALFFEKTTKAFESVKYDQMTAWMESCNIAVPARLFAASWSFTACLNKYLGDCSSRFEQDRMPLFVNHRTPKLGDIIDAKAAACAEIALLAHQAFHRMGVESDYFIGGLLRDPNQEFPEPHAFLLIRDGQGSFIYDPANPTHTTAGTMPSLYPIAPEQMHEWEQMRERKSSFLFLENALSRKAALFGVTTRASVNPEKDFIYPHQPELPQTRVVSAPETSRLG